MECFEKSQQSAFGLLKRATLKGMRNSNTKTHYINDSKLHQLDRHCDLFGTIAVLNTIPGSNINIKEITDNYECSL